MFVGYMQILLVFNMILTIVNSIVLVYFIRGALQVRKKLHNFRDFSAMGKKSGIVRQQKAFTKRAIKDFITKQNPLFAVAIEQMFPEAYDWLAKNPQALPAIIKMFAGNGAGGGKAGNSLGGLFQVPAPPETQSGSPSEIEGFSTLLKRFGEE